jgi:hypothetical protein
MANIVIASLAAILLAILAVTSAWLKWLSRPLAGTLRACMGLLAVLIPNIFMPTVEVPGKFVIDLSHRSANSASRAASIRSVFASWPVARPKSRT